MDARIVLSSLPERAKQSHVSVNEASGPYENRIRLVICEDLIACQFWSQCSGPMCFQLDLSSGDPSLGNESQEVPTVLSLA